jgi:hypothetical protein
MTSSPPHGPPEQLHVEGEAAAEEIEGGGALGFGAQAVSVRKVVPTLTSKSAEIYPSMVGAKQLVTLGFILVPAEAVRLAVVCSGHYICVTLWCLQRGATSEVGEEAGPPGPRGID